MKNTMTVKQKIDMLQDQHDELLNRQGYYSKGVARLSNQIARLKKQIEKPNTSNNSCTSSK